MNRANYILSGWSERSLGSWRGSLQVSVGVRRVELERLEDFPVAKFLGKDFDLVASGITLIQDSFHHLSKRSSLHFHHHEQRFIYIRSEYLSSTQFNPAGLSVVHWRVGRTCKEGSKASRNETFLAGSTCLENNVTMIILRSPQPFNFLRYFLINSVVGSLFTFACTHIGLPRLVPS